MERPDSSYVTAVDGVSIGYQVFGAGPYDLVLNEGWMSNIDANWDLDESARLLHAWGQRARVISFDRRGFGISDRPATPGQMAIEKSLDDMRAVMDAAGSERAVVFGLEAGAAVSLLFAASYPERVIALILFAPLVRYRRTPDSPAASWVAEKARSGIDGSKESWGTVELWRWNLDGSIESDSDGFDAPGPHAAPGTSPAGAIAPSDLTGRRTPDRPSRIQVPTL